MAHGFGSPLVSPAPLVSLSPTRARTARTTTGGYPGGARSAASRQPPPRCSGRRRTPKTRRWLRRQPPPPSRTRPRRGVRRLLRRIAGRSGRGVCRPSEWVWAARPGEGEVALRARRSGTETPRIGTRRRRAGAGWAASGMAAT